MKFRVDIFESERGWGTKLDEIKYFESEDAAQKSFEFVDEFNSKNNETTAPDWYMYANPPERIE